MGELALALVAGGEVTRDEGIGVARTPFHLNSLASPVWSDELPACPLEIRHQRNHRRCVCCGS